MAIVAAVGPDGTERSASDLGGREATGWQAHLLLLIACLPILGMLVIAPVLPDMQRHFAAVPGVEFLVPFVLTAPALMIVLVSPFAGRIAGVLGRKRALLAALYLYLFAATAPLYLNSLLAILLSRLCVGVAEALLMTVSTMLLGDYFLPARRDRYLAYQVIYTSVSAVLFLLLGGMLGESGWRTPFVAYSVAMLLIPCVHTIIWEPSAQVQGVTAGTAKLPWAKLTPIYALTFFAGGCMTLVGVELGYVIEAVGVTSSVVKGIGAAVNSAGIAIGAALVSAIVARRLGHLIVAFILCAIGYALMGSVPQVGVVIAGGGIAGMGAGFYLGWLLSAVNAPLSFNTRGRGVGLWMASYFLATVVAPASAVALSGPLGGIQPAMLPFAGLMVMLSLVAPWSLKNRAS